MKKKKIYTILTQGTKVNAWYGGDGTRVPVWERTPFGLKEARAFVKHNAYHKPILIKATLIYELEKSKKQ